MLRIVFMGTPDFAVGVLRALVENGSNIVGVITAADKPSGRGRKLSQSAVKEYAVSEGLKVLQPVNLKSDEFLDELRALNANLQIVVAFRMLPKAVWAMPEFGTFNLHASLLPDYRGAAPINWAIINNEKESGVTTFFIDEKIDTGAIILNRKLSLDPDETAGSLHDKLMDIGSELVLETVHLIEQEQVSTVEQPREGTSKEAPKLNAENTRIDWSQPADRIDALVRGLNPYPVAWTMLDIDGSLQKIKVYKVAFEEDKHSHEPGRLISSKKEIKIAVPDGYIHLLELQLPGKRKMKAMDLLNGYSFPSGCKVV